MTIFGIPIVALGLYFVALMLFWRYESERSRKAGTIFVFLAGFCISGSIYSMLSGVFKAGGNAGGHLFSVPTVVFLTLLGIGAVWDVWIGMNPKNDQQLLRRHPYVAGLAPIVLGLSVFATWSTFVGHSLDSIPIARVFGA